MFTVKLDQARLDNAIRGLARAYKKTTAQVIRQQAKLLIRDCVKFTPPMTFGKESSESFASQRRVGLEAVRNQVKATFLDPLNLQMVDRRAGKGTLGRKIRDAVEQGQNDLVLTLMGRAGFHRVKGVVRDASLYLHKKQRSRTGRVYGSIPWIVTNPQSIKEVLRARLAMVGTAKSGWVRAATALGLKLPGWITRGGGSGIFSEQGGEKPAITVGNTVPYIQSSGAALRIMERAMKNRVRNIEKELEHALRAASRS